MAIQFRRGNQADLVAGNLLNAEPAYSNDTERFLIGNGSGGVSAVPTTDEVISIANDYVSKRIAIGTILAFAGDTIPDGTLLCDGQAVSRTEYAELFEEIGTTYGSGDGGNTFNVPNLKGRVPVGKDALQSEFDTLGETGGAKTHTLTESQIPSHAHNIKSASGANEGAINTNQLAIGREGTIYANKNPIETAGGGQSHNNLQPYVTINYIIIARPEVTHGDIESALADLVVETQSARDNANAAAAAANQATAAAQVVADSFKTISQSDMDNPEIPKPRGVLYLVFPDAAFEEA